MSWYDYIAPAVGGAVGSGIYDIATGNGDSAGYLPWNWGKESDSTKEQREDLKNQAGMSSWFADQGQQGYGDRGAEALGERDRLRRIANGQDSLAKEQLRQAFAQQAAQQRAMAAGAAPSSAPMAARTAMMNTNRAQSAMSGQAAMAGVAERQAAAKALQDAILQQRSQDMQVALGGRQNAINAYGGYKPEGSWFDKYGNAVTAAAGMAMK